MDGRILPTAVALAALGAAAPASQAAPAPTNWIGIAAPKTAKPGKAFKVRASASFDPRRYAPPRRYLAAGVWRHRGDDPCARSVPIDRRGWTQVGNVMTFMPRGGPSDAYSFDLLDTTVTLRATGAYRHCGYVYELRYSGTSYKPEYGVLATSSALTRVRRG